MLLKPGQPFTVCSNNGGGVGVRGRAEKQRLCLSAPETPAPPAAVAGRSPDPPASDAAETPPSDAAPPEARHRKHETHTLSRRKTYMSHDMFTGVILYFTPTL